MKRIGLTGGIGSGKSTVARIFMTLGIPVYESDPRAKALMNSNPQVREAILQLFGPKAYTDGELNRAWIAQQVFGNESLLQQLNAIVHPAVKEDVIAWSALPENASAPYVLKESAILFEEHLTQDLDAIILVAAPEAIRIQRVINRDQVTEAQVRERMQHQWPDEEKIPLADFIIYNDGQRSLIEQVTDIDRMIRETVSEKAL